MKLKLKDPWSAITHGVAGLLAIAGAAPLLLKAFFCVLILPPPHKPVQAFSAR